MLTDRPPRNKNLQAQFLASDRLEALHVPLDDRLIVHARAIEVALKAAERTPLRHACGAFLAAAAEFYQVRAPQLRVLAARPLRVREGGWATELFGDYDPETIVIRVWMRTAVRKQVTSYGTFFSTLVHEFCHHLDIEKLGFRDSPHTRGFYHRVAVLYHHARQTPAKQIVWAPVPGGTWRVDWSRMNRKR
jgi:hypothetical protein